MCFKCVSMENHITFLNFKFETLSKHGADTGNLKQMDDDSYIQKVKDTVPLLKKLKKLTDNDPELLKMVEAYTFYAESIFSLFLARKQVISGDILHEIAESFMEEITKSDPSETRPR